MPIYAYKCGSCGHAKDVLRKVSDAPLSTCPACGQESFSKQITAAGFQLKGSGWYATDFRNNGASPKAPDTKADTAEAGAASPADAKPGDSKPADTKSADTKSTDTSTGAGRTKPAESTSSAKTDTPPAAAGCGRSSD